MRICLILLAAVALTAAPSGLTVSVTGSPSWAPDVTVRAGAPFGLTATATCAGTCSYTWLQTAGAPLDLSSTNVAAPSVSLAARGEYTFRATVRDSSDGATATTTLTIGAVATDNNGVVIPADTRVTEFVGPLIRWGANQWSYLDDRQNWAGDRIGRQILYADGFPSAAGTITLTNGSTAVTGSGTSFTTLMSNGAVIYVAEAGQPGGWTRRRAATITSNTALTLTSAWQGATGSYVWSVYGVSPAIAFQDTWHAHGAGTVTLTNGSTTVTGSGTAFRRYFLCDGATDVDRLVVNVPAASGVTLTRMSVASCASDTSLTLSSAWTGTTGTYSYGSFDNNQDFQWSSGATNINYYDLVLGFYAQYHRSGLTKWQTYARTLAVRWWTSPTMNRTLTTVLPRVLAYQGLWMCAVIDTCTADVNMSAFFSDFEASYVSGHRIFVRTNSWPSNDAREESYRHGLAVMLARWHPTGSVRTAAIDDIDTGLTVKWTPVRAAQAVGAVFIPAVSETGPSFSTVSVSGSTVTGTGFTTPCPNFATGVTLIRFANETVTYKCTASTSTTITLDRAYVGTAGTKSMQTTTTAGVPLLGYGVQPFINGIVAHFFFQHFKASGNTTARAYARELMQWTVSAGANATNGGAYYGRIYDFCEPTPTIVNCVNGGTDVGDEGARFYSTEIMGALSQVVNDDQALTTLIAQGDAWYAANWGRYGGPGTTVGWTNESMQGGTDSQPLGWIFLPQSTYRYKDYGFAMGMGRAGSWPAARIGGAVAPSIVTYSISYALPAGATSARLQLTQPDGTTSTVACGASPCSFTVDARQKPGLFQVEYLNGESVVAASASEML